jgi:hypothetical protein
MPALAAQDHRPVRLRGYVVDVIPPAQLTLEDYRITEDRVYNVRLDPDVGLDTIRIGAELELMGILESTGEFRAATYKRRPAPVDETPAAATISTAVPLERGERGFWESLRLEIKEPDFARRRSGGVTIRRNTHYEVIAKAEVQAYIAEIGWRLVPAYQRDLPNDDPTKIPFKFYIARNADFGAVALANGVVVVFSGVFDVLQNEAQLASILAHEISHVTQKHGWKLSKMTPAARLFGYNRSFENQADRLSLVYAIDAGYDPREAPRSWTRVAKKLGFTPLRESHENYAMRRAFMMSELAERYRTLDYSARKVEESRFRHIAELLKKP